MNTLNRPRAAQRFLLTSLLALVASPAFANEDPSGDLDTTFNTTGNAVTNVTTRATFSDARGTAVQPDGRIVVAGDYDGGGGLTHISVTRYNPDGSVDGSFGAGGEVKTTLSSSEIVNGLALQSDGKIVVIGSVTNAGNEDFFAVRYTAAGVLDTSFNGTGFVTIQLGVNTVNPPIFDRAQAVAIQADSKIVVAGYSDNNSAAGNFGRDMSFARLNTNGSLDATFGTGGKLLVHTNTADTSTTERALAVTIQPTDQKIVAGGRGSPTQFGIIRLNTNGTLDSSFGTAGHVVDVFNAGDSADRFQSLQVDAAGKIYGAGMSYNGTFHMIVSKMNSNGSFDTSFNGSGHNAINILGGQDQCRAIGVQSDGKVVCSGVADSDGSGNFKMFAARFNANGSVDTTFNGSGKFSVDASGTGLQNDALAGALQSDNKYLIVGTAYPVGTQTATEIAVVRLTTAGVPDTTFDGDGIVFRQLLGGSTDYGYGIAVQSDGKFVVVGDTADATSGNAVLARYNTNGSLDAGFGTAGLVISGLATYNETTRAVLVQPDQKIVTAGSRISLTPPSPPHQLTATRYNANGTLDATFGSSGVANAPLGANAGAGSAIARQTDGKILVAGGISDSASAMDFYVARFTTAGVLDSTFGTGGATRINVGAIDEAYAIALQTDGKILLAGYAYVGGGQQFALVRLNANGSTDNTFGTNGIVKTSVGDAANQRNRFTGVVVLASGRIIAGGVGNDGTAGAVPVFRTVRYNTSGTIDTSYGTNGISSYSITSGANFSNGYALGLQFDEKVIVFGDTTVIPGGAQDFAIARFNWDNGSIDTTYGTNGQVVDAITPGLDGGYAGIMLPNGAQAMAGLAQQSDLGIAKFKGDPAPTVPGVPDLTTDTGSSSTDNITNNNLPTFNVACSVGDTVWLKVDSLTPPSRTICRTSPQAVQPATAISDGVHAITAFARNGAGDSAVSAALSITVDTIAAAVSISAPVAASSVLPNPTIAGGGAESGVAVSVTEGANSVCSTTSASDGTWSCNSTLGIGSHTVSVTQTDIAGNTSTPTTRTFVVKLATSTALGSSVTPSTYGQNVVFTATVSATGGTPNGSVAFVIDGGAPQNIALTGGVATLSTAALAAGTHTVAANYAETTGYFASNATLSGGQTVSPASTTVALSSSAPSVAVNTPITLTAQVTAVAPGAGIPSGNVAFTDNGAAIAGCATVPLDQSGVATCGPVTLPAGIHPIAAGYLGNSNFNANSDTTSVTVTPSAPSAPLLDVGSDSGSSNADNITNAATPLFIGNCTTGDSIALHEGPSSVGPSQLCTGGAYAIAVSLSEGVHLLNAVATHGGASSAASTPNLSVTIDRTALPPVINSPVGAVVNHPSIGGTGEIGATLTLKEGATSLCTTVVDGSGNWQCNTSLEGAGDHTLHATQTDIAGNTSASSVGFVVTIDFIFIDGFDTP